MKLTAILKKGEKQYVALCPEIDVVSQGYTVEEAIKNLKEAAELYLEVEGLPAEKFHINKDIFFGWEGAETSSFCIESSRIF